MESSSRTVFDMQKAHFLPNSPSKFLTNINMGPIVDEDFESILSGLEIPMDSLEADGYGEDWCLKADRFGEDWDASVYEQLLGPIPSDTLMAFPLDANDGLDSRMTNISNEFSEAQESVLFQTRSLISVLKNSGSFKVGSKGRRSKRARKSTLNPWLLMSPMPCTTSSAKKNSDAKSGKEKKRKLSGATTSSLFKRCTHCEVTKTPQWREGPLGPKTLCNACGVRYRSGRLLPEYRPAASPTFIPSLHSNSHRKVIEMRRKTVLEDSPLCDIQNFVPQSSYLLDYCTFS